MKKTINFKDYKLYFVKSHYVNNNNTAIQVMVCEENYDDVFMTLTVNIVQLDKEWASLDTNNDYFKLIPFLEEKGLIKNTNRYVRSGFCDYPIYNIKSLLDFIE